MAWRAGPVGLVALLVVLSVVTGPALAGPPGPGPGEAPVGADGPSVDATNHTPPDPETDVIGWEAGVWANESIAVNQSDGLNATERNATVARAMARVETIRQLEFERPIPVAIQSREAYQAARENDTVSPALRRFDNVKFEALFLIGEDEDSIEVQNENAGVSVLGFYSPRREAIVVISENASTLQLNELTLAHELTHALQDQHFNLSRYDARTRDGANAESGLIEGDASLVELRYRQRCAVDGPWNGTCLRDDGASGGGGSLANIGAYLMKFQPYSDGPRFITSLYAEGGWAAVNEAYAAPPQSSEQVIHPEKYRTDPPTNVSLTDRHRPPWERVRPPNRPDYGTVGEAGLSAMLVFTLYESNGQTRIIDPAQWLNQTADGQLSEFDPLRYENRFVAGWDGDRLHVYVNDANETAYVWRLVWDSPADAREFVEGYRQVLEYWGGEEIEPGGWVIEDGAFADAFALRVEGDTVTVVNAPTVEALPSVREGATSHASPTVTPTTPVPTTSASTTPTATLPVAVTPGQPGFGPVAAVVAVLLGLLWRRRA